MPLRDGPSKVWERRGKVWERRGLAVMCDRGCITRVNLVLSGHLPTPSIRLCEGSPGLEGNKGCVLDVPRLCCRTN
jgi:hypothetical protein